MKRLISTVLASGLAVSSYAATFRVKNIEVNGLSRINRATVLHYLPVKAGGTLNESKLSSIIQTLYSTNFFTDVNVYRSGNTLILNLTERPTIADIIITGNQDIKKEQLDTILTKLGLVQGEVYDPSALSQLRQVFEDAYEQFSKYDANVQISANHTSRNRVNIVVNIKEGPSAKIADIVFSGNHVFSQKQLRDQMSLSTPGFFSFITGDDKYTSEQLDKDLNSIRQFYLDHGYLRYRLLSKKADLSKDKKTVTLTIKVDEGACYHITGFKLSGNLGAYHDALMKLITLKPGETFSQTKIIDINKAIAKYLGDRGYAFARMNTNPSINDKTQSVYLDFQVVPGKRVYVHKIKFAGNTKTADPVLRRELRQFEGDRVSVGAVNESLRRLRNLGYLQNVSVSTDPVPGKNNQVDLTYHVKEQPSAQAMFGIGYGTEGFLYNASLQQQNFLGTGDFVSVVFNHTEYQRTLSFQLTNPYYTPNGISRSFNFYNTYTTPGALTDLVNYTTNKWGGGLSYGIPLSYYDTLSLGGNLAKITITPGSDPSQVVTNFINENGRRFVYPTLDISWNHNSFDQRPFTTKGISSTVATEVAVPVASHKLAYYKVNYDAEWFYPVYHNFIFSSRVDLGYGKSYGPTKGGLPFFQNYFAGGADTVRGYDDYSLGPKDSDGNALGGNAMAVGSVSLIFPNPLSDKLRTALFFDAGNVYNTTTQANLDKYAGVRTSAGLSAQWHLPYFPVIEFDFVKPLNPKAGDHLSYFQFTFGTNF